METFNKRSIKVKKSSLSLILFKRQYLNGRCEWKDFLTEYILQQSVSIVVDTTNLDKDFALFLSFESLRYHLQQYFLIVKDDVDVDNETTKQ